MATLTGQTIASSYEQLLSLPDGGGNTTNLVAVTDGDAGTTFALKLATTSISIGATNKLYLDGGTDTYLHEVSADKLDIVVGNRTILEIAEGGGGASDSVSIQALNKLYLDGGTHTYIQESADGIVDFYADSVHMLQLLEGGTDYVWLPVDSEILTLGAGKDLQIYHDGSDSYMANSTGALKLATESSGIAVSIGHTTSETTVNDNLTVTGAAAVGGNLTVTGALALGSISGNIIMADDTSIGISDTDERIEFDGAGDISFLGCNVGIGTTDPTGLLDIVGSVAGFDIDKFLVLQNTNSTNNDHVGIGFSTHTNTGDGNIKQWFGVDRTDTYGRGDFVWINDAAGNNDAAATGDEVMRLTSAGLVGIGTDSPTEKLHVYGSAASDHIARFFNDGANVNAKGLLILCGTNDAGGGNGACNSAITIDDGDGTVQGTVSFTGGTVTYGAFTANHVAELPSSDNSAGYDYGTLVEITEIFYKKKSDGTDTERGILYKVQKTSSAYSKAILGSYAMKDTSADNDHNIYVLGDGHILCNNEKGNISVGDGICSSSTAGIGMKADKTCMIIGIAQENTSFTGTETKLVPVQYQLTKWTPWD